MTRVMILRTVSLVVAVGLMALVLAAGSDLSGSGLEAGESAPRDFFAERSAEVPDPVATEAAVQAALEEFEPVYVTDAAAVASIEDGIDAVFAFAVSNVAGGLRPVVRPDFTAATTTTEPSAPTTTTASDTTTTSEGTEPPPDEVVPDAMVVGQVFVDVNGDGILQTDEELFGVTDTGIGGVPIVALSNGATYETVTANDGRFQLTLPSGEITVAVDPVTGFPSGFIFSTATFQQDVECGAGEQCEVFAIGITGNVRSLEDQVASMRDQYAFLGDETLFTLATIATGDVYRVVLGERPRMLFVNNAAIDRVRDVIETEIKDQAELDAAKNNVVRNPPFVVLPDGTRDDAASAAAAEIVSSRLQITETIDQAATDAARQDVIDSVPTETQSLEAGDLIVRTGEELTAFQIDAIERTGALTGRTLRRAALVGMLTMMVASLGFYLARFRPQFWHAPRMVALWATLLVLAAGAVRLAIFLEPRSGTFYVLPAVAFGYLAAVLFDNRMGTLMALAMAMLAAVGTEQAGVAVFGLLATLAPIGFVSKVSTRRAFRNSVVVSSLAVAAIAGTATWFFDTGVEASLWESVGLGTAWAFGAALVASLVALAVMPFFESAFDVTTTLRLLELTDRNHEALQLLQEKAFGTFNHSLMVGTLADSAAKAIGGNNLLARAAAYYHDLGKTENPTYYIENQFGISNPHDDLPPEESAKIIRAHVTDGIRLAARYRIPSEVSEGILAHHGDAIMRYFFEKARQYHGGEAVDPDDYRHAGHKPRSREMAIVMMADSVEGACRAVFAEEEPTAESIRKVVNRVIDEKVGDGQLNDSDLTLSELTKVRSAFIEALVGHYHQRIQYPNFPGA